ncbi:cbb3-type cytochrome c oxidase subunit I [Effusibacillus lacus]|uniref:Cytochrome c oxidase, cbb3-type subunit I n=1 Tax=Effusibacillus lacus TaxID=1348429 RepID=A0A292YMC5_9BACL|nr:cbb3-type cytochrome c oxidase subunit I [Effusibacillus lacus]TCS70085.1 cytochrome c oxidase cbb3-type subunit 1 [Effusibacillus lacus]GAX91078.1 cytochrome c oxidase, cbb3-type subunit I [Effusibacillus lacus]
MSAVAIRPYTTAKIFIYTSIVWLLLGMILALLVAIKSIHPDFLTYNRWLQEYFTYGRLRPLHTNTVLFGFLSPAYFAMWFYIIPVLCKTSLYSERLGVFTAWAWSAVYAVGMVMLFMGRQVPVEYSEMPLVIDIPIIILVALMSYNLIRTILNRKERILYVTLWYFLGTMVWLPGIYIVGNIPGAYVSGIAQTSIAYTWVHNIIGIWFTPAGVGTIYYLMPKLTGNPLYSHKLSLIGFWTIIAFYIWNGPHHLVNGPIPLWLMKAGIIPSILLIIPVWTVLANVIGTMKGAWYKVAENLELKFMLTGALFYFLSCIQGPFQSLMGPNAVLHFTYWTVGHAHMPLFAGFGLVAFAGIYYALPRIIGRQIYSRALMNWHYWLSVVGFLIFAFAMWLAGVLQGFGWMDGNQVGAAFVRIVESLHIYLIARAIGGTFMFLGAITFAWNIYKTATAGKQIPVEDPLPAL